MLLARVLRRWRSIALLGLWLLTGIFVVRGNEVAALRVCGRLVRLPNGQPDLKPSGLYFSWPYPIARVDRVNLSEVRTLTVGGLENDAFSNNEFLRAVDASRQSQFLSGDKNVLHVTLKVQYRVSREAVDRWLFESAAPEQRLQVLSGAVLADVVLRCGVDFVHTLGHNEIRQETLKRLRELAARDRLGVEIEDVTLAGVAPPLRVKSEFLDVMNARADRETYINRARAYAEQRQADSSALSRKTLDEAESFRQQAIEQARAEAESFDRLVAQLKQDAATSGRSYVAVRKLALDRLTMEATANAMNRIGAKHVLSSDESVDLTLQPRSPSSLPTVLQPLNPPTQLERRFEPGAIPTPASGQQ